MIDPTDLSTSTDMNSTSPADDSTNRVDIGSVNLDCDLSLDSFLDSIGMQQTDPILGNDLDDIHDMQDIHLFSQQPTTLRGTSSAAKVAEQGREDLGSSGQAAAPSYEFNTSLLMPRADSTAFGIPTCNIDRFEILLSQLHLELCNLLCCVRSAPWDVQDALRLTLSPEINGRQDGEIGDAHPLIQVSKVSRELESLLDSLHPSLGAAEHSALTISYPSGPPSLCTTQLLVALSCYIQIVSIYDSIFSTVFEYLASGGAATSLTSVPSSQQHPTTPTLYLAGLPILPNRKLCGTLLVHQIEHQLERIEMLVGLPEHYRISSKSGDDGRDVGSGLFAGQHSQSLLNAVFQLGEFRPGEHNTRCVRSLKMKMRQIKDL